MRVLSVCETAFGGVGRYQLSLSELTQHGVELSILVPEEDSEILDGMSDVLTFSRGARGAASLWRFLSGFMKCRRNVRPNLYYFNSTFSLFALLVLRFLRDGTPAVYCPHCWAICNYDERSVKGRVVRMIEGQLSGLADLVVNVSHGDAALARRLGYRGRHIVVENAVPDADKRQPSADFQRGAPDEVHLLFVGRFDRQKGLDILLPAFAKARANNPDLHLHLVGGPVRDGSVPDLPEGVVNHGWAKGGEIDGYLKAADALVVPSRWEGLPLVVPEAFRNGTPVLLANRSDMGALIEEGATGAVFELTVDALAGCLAQQTKPVLEAMRPAARGRYEARFSLPRFVEDQKQVIRMLTSAGSELS